MNRLHSLLYFFKRLSILITNQEQKVGLHSAKKKGYFGYAKTIFLVTLLAIITLTILPITMRVQATDSQTFRPFYAGYQSGTAGPYTNPTNLTAINREWNLVGWTVSSLTMSITWCKYNQNNMGNTSDIVAYISQDSGITYTSSVTFANQVLDFEQSYPGGFFSATATYDLAAEAGSFGPNTRIKIEINPVESNTYLSVLYWGAGQTPTPPYDYLDGSNNYVQYNIGFDIGYTENTVPYSGSTLDFSGLPVTLSKVKLAADMIVSTVLPSGAGNEIVGKTFGTDSWVVIYSSQLGMMELINAEKVLPSQNYLLTVKRFIAWMWSKQNVDGSFYFTLTDGDLHIWSNSTADEWYGYDKIDSFSACAISLMRKYYDATGDLAFVNLYWSEIALCKMFLTDLMNTTLWIPVDGYHYDIGSGYTKSTTSLLHDSCEVYQGLKDYAFLEGVRGNASEEAYWNAYGDAIADGIRTYFWNETLQRYSGYYDIALEKQDTTLVYGIVAPTLYDVETNSSRAALTVKAYADWGVLGGRYLYGNSNEYSTMCSMLYASLSELRNTYNYNAQWMERSFYNVTELLFCNPIFSSYNLQNSNGILDYVNFASGTYATDSARLVEASAWFIHAMIKTPNMASIYDAAISLESMASYWNTQYNAFYTATHYTSSDAAGYSVWISWLNSNNLYVDWFSYQFLRRLTLQGYINSKPWWEQWTPTGDWLREMFTWVPASGSQHTPSNMPSNSLPQSTPTPSLNPTPTPNSDVPHDELHWLRNPYVIAVIVTVVSVFLIAIVLLDRRN